MKKLVSLFVGVTALIGLARADIHIKVPAGNIMVWTTDSALPGLPPADATAAINGVADLTSSKGTIAAFDPKTGLMAYHKGSGDLNFSKGDFKFVPELTVNLTGKGSASGVEVSLSSPETSDSVTVDFKDGGKAIFHAVGAGSGTVDVSATVGTSTSKASISKEFKPDPSGKLRLDIPLNLPAGQGQTQGTQSGSNLSQSSESTATGGQPEDATQTEGANASTAHKVSGWAGLFGQAVTLFLGIIIIAAVAYGLYWLFVKKPDEVAARLRALGAPIPQAVDPNTTPANSPTVSPDPPMPVAPAQILIPGATIPASGVTPAPGGLVANPMSSAPAVSMQSTLTAESGAVFTLQDGANPVGRESNLAISFAGDSSVSRHHADVIKRDSGIFVTDAGSTNGTYVNGTKITGETQIHTGDVIQFGAVRVRLQE